MATGALDANGIWQYGEDDSEATFSALLNKLGSSTSTTVTRLEEMSGISSTQAATARANLRVGLVPISPSSVAQAGGSASANSLGLVTFTTVTSLSLNGVFTSDYRNYRFVTNFTTSASADVLFKMRNAGTDASGNDYQRAIWYVPSGGGAFLVGSTNTAGTVIGTDSSSAFATGDILAPQLAQRTNVILHGAGRQLQLVISSTSHTLGNSYDGITFFTSTGSMTGTVQIFAYND